MTEAIHRGLDRVHGPGARRAVDEDNGQAKGARGGDLAVGGLAPAVLGHDHLDAPGGEQRALVGLGKGASGEERLRAGRQVGGRDGLDAADEVGVLRRGAEGRDLLPADGEQDAPGRPAEGRRRRGHVRHADPAVAGARLPRRALQDDEGNGRCGRGPRGVFRDPAREGMGRVHENGDGVGAEPVGEAVRSSEAAHANGGGRKLGRAGPAGEGKRDPEARAGGKAGGERPGLAGAAKDEDVHGII